MQYLDDVRLISDKYEGEGYYKGARGAIILPEIRSNTFEVEFFKIPNNDYPLREIHVADLEFVRSGEMTDEDILDALPGKDPHWWCKVEDGYILNLLGERKNKIPYDYES